MEETKTNGVEVVSPGGALCIAISAPPSLREVLESNQTWKKVYVASDEVTQEELLENAKDHFNMAAADIVVKMHVAGHTAYEIAEDTGLSRNYVYQTMEALQIEDLKQQGLELGDEG